MNTPGRLLAGRPPKKLGLHLDPGRLLVVDWAPAHENRPALANYLFDGGVITAAAAEHDIRLQSEELTEWRLTGPKNWDQFLVPQWPVGSGPARMR